MIQHSHHLFWCQKQMMTPSRFTAASIMKRRTRCTPRRTTALKFPRVYLCVPIEVFFSHTCRRADVTDINAASTGAEVADSEYRWPTMTWQRLYLLCFLTGTCL